MKFLNIKSSFFTKTFLLFIFFLLSFLTFDLNAGETKPIISVDPSDAEVKFEFDKLKMATDSDITITNLPETRWPPIVEIIADSSGSMAQELSKKKSKMYFLKKIMGEYLTLQWKKKGKIGLRIYGGRRKHDCADNFLALNFSYKNLSQVENTISRLVPIGNTPLHQSVIDAVQDVKSFNGPRRIVIVTDGEDTCGGDPCNSSAELRKQILDLKFYVVALGFKGESDALKKINCIGETSIVNDENSFKDAMSQIDKKLNNQDNLQVISPNPNASVYLYKIIDNKRQLLRVFYANNTIYTPPGEYEAIVNLTTPYLFKSFIIPPGKKVTLKVAGDGTVIVNYYNSLLNVELIDKNQKVISKFKTDIETPVPNGEYFLRVFKKPFFEIIQPLFRVLPNASQSYNVHGVGLVRVNTEEPTGLYVYNSKKELEGQYLTNFNLALKIGTYFLHVNDKCSFENITITEKKETLIFDCPRQ